MLKKAYKFDLKDLSEEGVFLGHLSVFGNKDCTGDIVDPGAYARTLQHKAASGKKFPILWQHDPDQPLGVFEEMKEDATGLFVKGRLTTAVQRASEAHALLKDGALDGLSIGYDVLQRYFKDGSRHLKEIKLYEGSLVTFPANDLATVTSVKSAQNALWLKQALTKRFGKAVDFAQALQEIQDAEEMYRLRRDIFSAFERTLSEVMWGSQSGDEKLAGLDASLEDLKAVVMSWGQRCLDLADPDESFDEMGFMSGALPDRLKTDLILPPTVREQLRSAVDFLKPLLENETGSGDTADGHSPAPETPQESGTPNAAPANLSDSDTHSLDGISTLLSDIQAFAADTAAEVH